MSTRTQQLPIAVIGAGPVGLAAAARLVERGLVPLVFERGACVGTALLEWGHVRVFSPWAWNIDTAAQTLLKQIGWLAPDPDELPTGREIAERYLAPLAAHPGIAPHVILNAQVTAISRATHDKMTDGGRDTAPFCIRWRDPGGGEHEATARAVIDASGAWSQPNPMGVNGLPVLGEATARERIAYGIPDVLGRARADYENKRTLVVGGGHSAINVVLDLVRLQASAPQTTIVWALRKNRIEKLLGGGLNDQLPGRGELGVAAMKAIVEQRLDAAELGFMLRALEADVAQARDRQAALQPHAIVGFPQMRKELVGEGVHPSRGAG